MRVNIQLCILNTSSAMRKYWEILRRFTLTVQTGFWEVGSVSSLNALS
jgi:hypothetical protein